MHMMATPHSVGYGLYASLEIIWGTKSKGLHKQPIDNQVTSESKSIVGSPSFPSSYLTGKVSILAV